MPRLKNRACTENRGESGKSRIANGSSNDSSISCKRQRAIQIEGRIIPIKLHSGSNCKCNAHAMYLHCIYTTGASCQHHTEYSAKKFAGTIACPERRSSESRLRTSAQNAIPAKGRARPRTRSHLSGHLASRPEPPRSYPKPP